MIIQNLLANPFFQKINTLYEKASIEVERKHFDLDILMGGDMKFLQLVLGLGGSLCNYSCSWYAKTIDEGGPFLSMSRIKLGILKENDK